MKTERHTTEMSKVEAPKAPTNLNSPAISTSEDGKEVYTSVGQAASSSASSPQTVASLSAPAPEPVVEEEDDIAIAVSPGQTCLRKGCGVAFVSDEVNRHGNGPGTACRYHPSPVCPQYTHHISVD